MAIRKTPKTEIKKIYALLVAINTYDQAAFANLNGCINDLADVENFFDSYCGHHNELSLNKKVLRNHDATRDNIIAAFSHFDAAQDGDICIFYFSGHGARIDAPKEFWDTTDSMLEAIVCHSKNGKDNLLIDKELSYLIEKATRDKDLHFVVIIDSCHSGSNTKATEYSVRNVPDNLDSRAVETYHGRAEYDEIKDEAGNIVRLTAPVGKHFKLSACLKNELSKEKSLGEKGETRGVFTYTLIEALKSNGALSSYANLINKVKIRAQALIKEQSPQLEIVKMEAIERSRVVFNAILANETPIFQISFHSEHNWIVNVGEIYGVKENDVVIIQNSNGKTTRTTIKKVLISHSILDFGPLGFGFDRNQIYSATIEKKSTKRLNLAFYKNSDKTVEADIKQLLSDGFSSAIEIDAAKGVDFIIHAEDDALALTFPDELVPVFKRIKGYGASELKLFIKLVEKVAKWYDLILLSNEKTTIAETDLHIALSSVDNPYKYDNPDSAIALPIDNWHEGNVFYYQFDENHPKGSWHPPAFRLSIENKSTGRDLWVSVLYCGMWYTIDDTTNHLISTTFSSTNRFLEKEKIGTDRSVKLIDEIHDDIGKSIKYESIELCLLDDYFEQGFNEIKDLIKIIVSSEELDTSSYNLEGIPIDNEGQMGSKAAIVRKPKQPDWRTFEIPITIVKPRDLGTLQMNMDKTFYGITIKGHPYFSAKIVLSTMEDLLRSSLILSNGTVNVMPRIGVLYGEQNVEVLCLTNNLGRVEGCSVIEFFRVEGIKTITSEKPLIFKMDDTRKIDPAYDIFLFSYDAAVRKYLHVGTLNSDKEIWVDNKDAQLTNSPATFKGLGNSIKMFFIKVKKEQTTAVLKTKETE